MHDQEGECDPAVVVNYRKQSFFKNDVNINGRCDTPKRSDLSAPSDPQGEIKLFGAGVRRVRRDT